MSQTKTLAESVFERSPATAGKRPQVVLNVPMLMYRYRYSITYEKCDSLPPDEAIINDNTCYHRFGTSFMDD